MAAFFLSVVIEIILKLSSFVLPILKYDFQRVWGHRAVKVEFWVTFKVWVMKVESENG